MDKTQHSIVCDHCERELVEDTSYPHRYALELRSVDYSYNTTGFIYGMVQHPLIDRSYHFCSLVCLWAWSTDQETAHSST